MPASRTWGAASSRERASLGMLGSFALSVTCARAINYVRERRRPAPVLRSWARRARNVPARNETRVHHFVPGVALAFLSGASAIFTHEDGRGVLLSIPFGVGVGMTSDEIAVMIERGNPYWKSEELSLAQAAAAALGAVALMVRIKLREP